MGWLMKYDPTIGRLQAWLLQTCCQSCADNPQCGGGMACLMPFVYSCIATLVLSVLLGGTIQQLAVEFRKIKTAETTTMYGLETGILFVSTLITYLALTVGVITGILAYRDCRSLG